MNQQKLQESIDWLKKELGEALVATDIFTDEGKQLAGSNFQKAIDCFSGITTAIRRQVEAAGGALPPTAQYYAVEFVDNKVVVMFVKGGLQWGLLVDTAKVEIGKAIGLAKAAAARLDAIRS